jgi:hypothetical protein
MNRETAPSSANFLRRTIIPYIGLLVICALVTTVTLWISYRISQPDMLIAILSLWVLISFNVWFGASYRVRYDDHTIYLRPAGWGGKISVPFTEVSTISENTASVSEMAQGNHPRRRVIVVGRRATQPIYISTRHFEQEDINQLVEAVVDRRPSVVLDKRVSHRISKDHRPPPPPNVR